MYMMGLSSVSLADPNVYDKTKWGGGDQVAMYMTTPSRVGVTDLDGHDNTEQGECELP